MEKCNNNCRTCKDYSCRCQDCIALREQENQWYCEIEEKFCKDITECAEYLN